VKKVKVKPIKGFMGVYHIGKKLATLNLVPGFRSANEKLIKIGGREFRIWDPYTSKPAAAIKKGLKIFPLRRNQRILYLGFASGKTASFFSDIIGKNGLIYGVEVSGRILREAFPMIEKRGNIIPILADARKPEEYKDLILEKVDLVYEDIADPDQIKILSLNSREFLVKGGFAMIAIKSQSIDVTKRPKEVYKECIEELEKEFSILDKVELDPYEKHHLFLVLRAKR